MRAGSGRRFPNDLNNCRYLHVVLSCLFFVFAGQHRTTNAALLQEGRKDDGLLFRERRYREPLIQPHHTSQTNFPIIKATYRMPQAGLCLQFRLDLTLYISISLSRYMEDFHFRLLWVIPRSGGLDVGQRLASKTASSIAIN